MADENLSDILARLNNNNQSNQTSEKPEFNMRSVQDGMSMTISNVEKGLDLKPIFDNRVEFFTEQEKTKKK